MVDKKKQDKLGKIFISFFALIIIFYCVASLIKDELNYPNYWGGVVFAPVGIIIGLLVLYIIWFRWKDVEKNEDAFKHNSKMDDFKKW